ncbi:hypothetical protein [Kingella oralis]|jgi:hypothetical protein|uniref:hypothetical protein n=1 Tax=Kingella oralis TaxID=505 RepID=UPI0028EF4C56|nr:hypothetical protein [Kingella oralis]
MNTQEPRPHLRFCLATLALAPILFTALHDLIALLLNHPRPILYTTQHQQRQWLAWDSQLLFAALIIYLLNAIIAFILARAAQQKMMRRQIHYALYLAGSGTLLAWLFGAALAAATGLGARAANGSWLLIYAATILIIALTTLPKQLTRAPVQTITFHKNIRRKPK